MQDEVVIIGYSGHSYVVIDIFLQQNYTINYYCDLQTKKLNPYKLTYLGTEEAVLAKLKNYNTFVAIGDNQLRQQISKKLINNNISLVNAIHNSSSVSSKAVLATGIMVGPRSVINSLSNIGQGVICNTGSIIEHECTIGDYSHIAPGAVLAGNVKVGSNTFIGANAVVKEGIAIGNNVIIGAGTVVIKDVPNYYTVAGNPQRILSNGNK